MTQQFYFWEFIQRTWNSNSEEHKHPYGFCSVIYNRQDMEAAQVSISRWVDKTTMGHLYNRILLGRKKEENFTICDSMDGPGKHYAKWYVESNEQTELRSKIETDSYMDSRWQPWRGVRRWRDQAKKEERTHGRGEPCGDCEGGEGGQKGDKW